MPRSPPATLTWAGRKNHGGFASRLRLTFAADFCGSAVRHSISAPDALLFDWSEEHVVLGGIAQKIKVAHFRQCHSRKPFVMAYPGEAQEMVLDAFVRALTFYGGVPRRVIIDNPKTMVSYVSRSKDRVFHPRFLALLLGDCCAFTCQTMDEPLRDGAGGVHPSCGLGERAS